MMSNDLWDEVMAEVERRLPPPGPINPQPKPDPTKPPERPKGVTDAMLRFMDGMKADGTKWPADKLKQRFQIGSKISGRVFQYWITVRKFYGVEYWGQVKEAKNKAE